MQHLRVSWPSSLLVVIRGIHSLLLCLFITFIHCLFMSLVSFCLFRNKQKHFCSQHGEFFREQRTKTPIFSTIDLTKLLFGHQNCLTFFAITSQHNKIFAFSLNWFPLQFFVKQTDFYCLLVDAIKNEKKRF